MRYLKVCIVGEGLVPQVGAEERGLGLDLAPQLGVILLLFWAFFTCPCFAWNIHRTLLINRNKLKIGEVK